MTIGRSPAEDLVRRSEFYSKLRVCPVWPEQHRRKSSSEGENPVSGTSRHPPGWTPQQIDRDHDHLLDEEAGAEQAVCPEVYLQCDGQRNRRHRLPRQGLRRL